MEAPFAILDDELVVRHIPGGLSWQAPPDGRVSSFNFRLRPSEIGISVSRTSLTKPAELLKRVGDPAKGSRVAVARVADIRTLGLLVEADPTPEDSGHALIRSGTSDLNVKSVHRQLAHLFQYVNIESGGIE